MIPGCRLRNSCTTRVVAMSAAEAEDDGGKPETRTVITGVSAVIPSEKTHKTARTIARN